MKHLWIGLLLVLSSGCEDDLRARIEAAGVYSPTRTAGVRQETLDLGQALFFDPELSGNRNVACASCHQPVDHAGDGHSLGIGQGATGVGVQRIGGVMLPRNTPSQFNRSFAQTLLWDGRIERLEDGSIRAPVPLPEGIETLLEAQALLPFLDRSEMRGDAGDHDMLGNANELAMIADEDPDAVWAAIMARLMAIDDYRTRFAEAFPTVPEGEHTIVHVVRAIAQFELRLWELTDTTFDAYVGTLHRTGADSAIQGEARRGANLFFGDAGCSRCHNGPLLSDDLFHNIGVPPSAAGIDEGRARVTGRDEDRFAFRTPPLRNVALTAPYLHDGSLRFLDEVIRQHMEPELGLLGIEVDPTLAEQVRATIDPDLRPVRPLTSGEIGDLVTFLSDSLTSSTELGILPGQGVPAEVPSGLPVQGVFGPEDPRLERR